MVESEDPGVRSDVEAEVLEAGSSAQQPTHSEEKEEKYEPFDCMYDMLSNAL